MTELSEVSVGRPSDGGWVPSPTSPEPLWSVRGNSSLVFVYLRHHGFSFTDLSRLGLLFLSPVSSLGYVSCPTHRTCHWSSVKTEDPLDCRSGTTMSGCLSYYLSRVSILNGCLVILVTSEIQPSTPHSSSSPCSWLGERLLSALRVGDWMNYSKFRGSRDRDRTLGSLGTCGKGRTGVLSSGPRTSETKSPGVQYTEGYVQVRFPLFPTVDVPPSFLLRSTNTGGEGNGAVEEVYRRTTEVKGRVSE